LPLGWLVDEDDLGDLLFLFDGSEASTDLAEFSLLLGPSVNELENRLVEGVTLADAQQQTVQLEVEIVGQSV
jgi:hypothetical protein